MKRNTSARSGELYPISPGSSIVRRDSGGLAYDAPEVITLAADNVLGDIRFKEGYTAITTGGKDRAMSTVSDWVGQDLTGLGTEGSGAAWTGLESGRYEVTWQVYASEDDADRDAFYLWDGSGLSEFTTRQVATNQRSATRWDSEWVTTTIDIYGDTDRKSTRLNSSQ